MNQKRFILFLLLLVIIFSGGIFYALDATGIVRASDILPFLAPKNPLRVEDKDYPTEVEKVEFQKWEQKLIEREEALAKREGEIKNKETGGDDQRRRLIKPSGAARRPATRRRCRPRGERASRAPARSGASASRTQARSRSPGR